MAISIIEIDGNSHPLGASADNVAFDGTDTGIEAGTVQEAIEEVSILAAEGAQSGVVDNLETVDGQKALSAGMGNKLDGKASVVFNHMHWVAGASSPSLNVGVHERYYCPENHTIYHFYGRIYASELTTTTLSYQPSKEVVYYDLETATAWRWNGTAMVLAVHPPYFMIADSTSSATIDGYNAATQSGSLYPRLVRFSALSKLVYFYMDGQTRRYVDFDPDPNRVYVRLGSSPKVVQWSGSAWVDVIDISSKANAADVANTYATKSELASVGETIVINSDGANIVDEHDNNSILVAPSARQMKLAYTHINSLQQRLDALIDDLAYIAFTGSKTEKLGTFNWVGEKIHYTLTKGTLTGCVLKLGSTTVDSTASVDEGYCVLTLVPTNAQYAFTSIKINNQAVEWTPTEANDGSVQVGVVVNGNLTVDATAVIGFSVALSNDSSNVSFNSSSLVTSTSVPTGTSLELTLYAAKHYTMPDSPEYVKVGNTTLQPSDFSYVKYPDGKSAVLTINSSKINRDIEIEVVAEEMDSMTVTFPSDHSHMVIKHGNDELTGDSVDVYEDDLNYAITFEPASGYMWQTAPNISGTALSSSGNIYTLEVTSVGSDITVSGATVVKPTLAASKQSLSFSSTANNAVTDTIAVSGSNLQGDITVSASGTGVTVCDTENGTYGSSVTITESSGSASGTVYVKWAASSGDLSDGSITVSSTGADSVVVPVTGVVAELPAGYIKARGIRQPGNTSNGIYVSTGINLHGKNAKNLEIEVKYPYHTTDWLFGVTDINLFGVVGNTSILRYCTSTTTWVNSNSNDTATSIKIDAPTAPSGASNYLFKLICNTVNDKPHISCEVEGYDGTFREGTASSVVDYQIEGNYLALFRSGSGNTAVSNGSSIHSMKIWDSGTLICDLVACKCIDQNSEYYGKYAIYNKLNGTFIRTASDGTTEFTGMDFTTE